MERMWWEKYRPDRIEDAILPIRLRHRCMGFSSQPSLPHLLLVGPPGSGKTTLARILLQGKSVLELEPPYDSTHKDWKRIDRYMFAAGGFILRRSDEAGVVYLEEAQFLTKQMGAKLRTLTEHRHSTASVMFVTNELKALEGAIRSRCILLDFNLSMREQEELLPQMIARCEYILREEGVDFLRADVDFIVRQHFPDMRATLGELQSHYVAKRARAFEEFGQRAIST